MIVESTKRIAVALNPESDRGVVLVVAAQLEACLEKHLKLRLVESVSKEDELIGRSISCVISSFGSKIALAYRVGIITPEERLVYEQLRKLRNDCAHEVTANSFVDERFVQRVKNIISAAPALWEAIHSNEKSENGDPIYSSVEEYVDSVGWRPAFVLFFSMIISHKQQNFNRVPRIRQLHVSAQ